MSGLVALEGRPWGEWRDGRAMSPRALAGQLKGFGIEPRLLRMGKQVRRGYCQSDFVDAFSRYLESDPLQTLQAPIGAAEARAPEPLKEGSVTDCVSIGELGPSRSVTHVTDSGVSAEDASATRSHPVEEPPALSKCPLCQGRLLTWSFGQVCTSCRQRFPAETAAERNPEIPVGVSLSGGTNA